MSKAQQVGEGPTEELRTIEPKGGNMSGLEMKYFVLKPRGTDAYAYASRKAMRAYAEAIHRENSELAKDLMEWADRETKAAQVESVESK